MIVPGQNVIALVLLANTPQLLFSTLYLLCNGLLTSMLAVAEYNDFATQRKPLRVSWPKGQQRSTYYLSLPYRYGISLIAVSIAMHWLLSQWWKAAASNRVQSETGCGYSPLATFIAMIAGATAMGVLVLFGLKRLRSNMPLASSCSAAISAACHPPPGDSDASLKPVKWGEVQLGSGNEQNVWPSETDGVNPQSSSYAHCTFTSKDVVTPSMIRLYC
ncbi:hypothetical protein PHISP_01505 [Aspergillus sp. HF37]|nr:hypothetical protein PHISP_01505 [Aspergillus sp. HF37]